MAKTIGETNGMWAVLLKILLVCFVPWGAFITVNQILDNQFRGAGERWTAQDAEVQTRAILNEVMLLWRESLLEHERLPGHSLLEQRVAQLERRQVLLEDAEAEETEILRQMQHDIREYISWVMSKEE